MGGYKLGGWYIYALLYIKQFIFNDKDGNTFPGHGESSGRECGKVLCDLRGGTPWLQRRFASLPVQVHPNTRPWHCPVVRLTMSSVNTIKTKIGILFYFLINLFIYLFIFGCVGS